MSWIRHRVRMSQIMKQRRDLTGVSTRWPKSTAWIQIYMRKAAWKKQRKYYVRDARASGALLYWRLKYWREDRERERRKNGS
jgi:hypothetical protein